MGCLRLDLLIGRAEHNWRDSRGGGGGDGGGRGKKAEARGDLGPRRAKGGQVLSNLTELVHPQADLLHAAILLGATGSEGGE
jgi:hypothetical protein